MDGLSSAVVNLNHSERTPPPVGKFTFNGVQSFITLAAVGYLNTVPANECWVDMVNSYLRLEEFPITKGVSVYLPLATPLLTPLN